MENKSQKPRINKIIKYLLISFVVILIFFSLLPYFIPLTNYDENSSPKPYANSAYTQVDGIKLHYQEWNIDQKTPAGKILFVHGFYGSTFSWRKNIEPLVKKGFYIIAVDVPGFGYSSKKTGLDHTLTGRATLLWDFLDKLDRNYDPGKELNWTLIGHSMGGSIVAKMAEQRQENISELVLVDPAINLNQDNSFSFLLKYPVFKRWTSVLAEYYFFSSGQIKALLSSAYGREPEEEEIRGYLDPMKQSGTSIAAADIVIAKQESIDLSKIKIATQIIRGENDTWISLVSTNIIKDGLEFSSITIVKDAGHVPQETNSDEFNKILSAFISAQRMSGGE